jgi:hypothetical protein
MRAIVRSRVGSALVSAQIADNWIQEDRFSLCLAIVLQPVTRTQTKVYATFLNGLRRRWRK